MDRSNNGPAQLGNVILEWVWYEGTDALLEGEAVCYNTNYGTATSRDGQRCNRVERPTSSNNKAFAGVAARNYAASSTGRFVEIYCPGSKGIYIALGANTVIDTDFLTFTVGTAGEAGRFVRQGYRGRGSAYIRQTVTALLESSMTGTWSLNAAGTTLTVASTAGLSAGDTVVLLGGEDDGTGACVPGKYVISAVASGTELTIPSAVDATAAGAILCTGYAYTGNPKCQADLMEGEESGGVEFLSPPKAGLVGLAYMTGGISYLCGGYTLSHDVDITFAQGRYPGEKKAFVCLGAYGTADFTVDLATNGIRLDGSTALAEILTMDDAGDGVWLEFHGARWFTQDLAVGATEN